MAFEYPAPRARIRAGDQLTGAWLSTPNPAFAELAGRFGLDFIVIDLEHGQLGLDDVLPVLRAMGGTKTAGIVRIPNHDETLIGRVLDRGAHGLLVPRVEDGATAARLAAAARYPGTAENGRRGLAIKAARGAGYGSRTDYFETIGDDILVAVQIESAAAAKKAKEIASAPGVDMAFIGPNDMSADMGLLGDEHTAAVRKAIDTILEECNEVGVPVGTIPYAGRGTAELFKLGFRLVVADSDIGIMRQGIEKLVG